MTAVTQTLQSRNIDFEVMHHPPAMTAIGEALALGVPADEVVKTVVMDTGDGGHVICAVPATRRVDMGLVRECLDDTRCHLATEDEMRADFPEFELGAFPPLASVAHAPVLVDTEVMTHPTVVFAGGTQTDSVRCRTLDVFEGSDVQIAHLTRDRETGNWIH